MSPTLSALILAWIAIVLLALACAGLLRQVRELRAMVNNGIGSRLPASGPASDSGGARPDALPNELSPDGRPLVVLKVDSKCAECHDAARALNELAMERRDEARYMVLADMSQPAWNSSGAVDVVTDATTYRSLTTPWTPALVVADPDGIVVSTGPARSGRVVHEAVDFALRHLAENAA